jgi:hypothetical protein
MKFRNITISKWRFGLILLIPVQIIVFNLIVSHHSGIEDVYSRHIYKAIVFVLRNLLGWIPLPIAQILLFALIVVPIIWIVRQSIKIKRKQQRFGNFLWNALTLGLSIFSVFYFLFMTLWGFNYHRQPVSAIVQINPSNITTTELEEVCEKLIRLTNESRARFTTDEVHAAVVPMNRTQMIEKAVNGYDEIAKTWQVLAYKNRSVKPVYFPQLMSMVGVGGIYIPYTGEAIVNMDPPSYLLPATICHEMAHQLGFSPEDEANYISFLVCRANPDPSFQYSGYFMAMRYAMNALGGANKETFLRLRNQLSKGVMADIEANKAYWNKFYNPISTFTSFFYDYFLKANGQAEGIRSYSLMVKLIVGDYRKNGLSIKK